MSSDIRRSSKNDTAAARKNRGRFCSFLSALIKASRGMSKSLPVILTVILIIALIRTYVPPKTIVGLFGFSAFTDTLIGGFFGSILAGNSINSYIIGNQLLEDGVPLAAVTAFLATWVIVGIAQLPAESAELGSTFALVRAGIGFLLAVIIALLVGLLFSGIIPGGVG